MKSFYKQFKKEYKDRRVNYRQFNRHFNEIENIPELEDIDLDELIEKAVEPILNKRLWIKRKNKISLLTLEDFESVCAAVDVDTNDVLIIVRLSEDEQEAQICFHEVGNTTDSIGEVHLKMSKKAMDILDDHDQYCDPVIKWVRCLAEEDVIKKYKNKFNNYYWW